MIVTDKLPQVWLVVIKILKSYHDSEHIQYF